MKRLQKAGFLSPRSFQITVTKENERGKKESARRRKEGEEKKSNGYTLSFYNSYFGEFLAEINCWTQKVHFEITFSKIRLKEANAQEEK